MEPILIAVGVAALAVFGLFVWLAYRAGWPWTGFAGSQSRKTLWDWLDLLLIPVGIVIVGFGLSVAQSDRERRQEATRAAREQHIAAERRRTDLRIAADRNQADVLR